jgi:hypothetical protein
MAAEDENCRIAAALAASIMAEVLCSLFDRQRDNLYDL